VIEPLKELEKELDEVAERLEALDPNSEEPLEQIEAEDSAADMPAEEIQDGQPQSHAEAKVVDQTDTPAGFFFDLVGNSNVPKLAFSPPKVRSPLESENEDSDASEVILFKGRSTPAETKKPRQGNITLDEIHIEIRKVERDISAAHASTKIASALITPPLPATNHGRETKSEEEDAIIADYIANMAAQDSDEDGDWAYSKTFNKRDLGGDDDAIDEDESSSSSSTDDDEVGDEEDEEEEEEVEDALDEDEESPDLEAEMDDETLARLLAKQEELGMDSSELLLFSDMHLDEGTGSLKTSTTRRKGRQGKPKSGLYPSASAVADAFDDLDLMDWNRASLQNFGKGRRGQPTFDVSDSELEAAMRTTWQKDRERKKQRKLEREELRANGLLGKNVNPDDPRTKYQTGMTLDDIKQELRDFLLGAEPRYF
jgi:hypothetical protein